MPKMLTSLIRGAPLALAFATMLGGSAIACGARNPCNIDNGIPIEELEDFWATIGGAKSIDEVQSLVKQKWHGTPIDFVGDDTRSGGKFMHVRINGIDQEWVAYYSRSPKIRVDVAILTPEFSGQTRRYIEVELASEPPKPPKEFATGAR